MKTSTAHMILTTIDCNSSDLNWFEKGMCLPKQQASAIGDMLNTIGQIKDVLTGLPGTGSPAGDSLRNLFIGMLGTREMPWEQPNFWLLFSATYTVAFIAAIVLSFWGSSTGGPRGALNAILATGLFKYLVVLGPFISMTLYGATTKLLIGFVNLLQGSIDGSAEKLNLGGPGSIFYIPGFAIASFVVVIFSIAMNVIHVLSVLFWPIALLGTIIPNDHAFFRTYASFMLWQHFAMPTLLMTILATTIFVPMEGPYGPLYVLVGTIIGIGAATTVLTKIPGIAATGSFFTKALS